MTTPFDYPKIHTPESDKAKPKATPLRVTLVRRQENKRKVENLRRSQGKPPAVRRGG